MPLLSIRSTDYHRSRGFWLPHSHGSFCLMRIMKNWQWFWPLILCYLSTPPITTPPLNPYSLQYQSPTGYWCYFRKEAPLVRLPAINRVLVREKIHVLVVTNYLLYTAALLTVPCSHLSLSFLMQGRRKMIYVRMGHGWPAGTWGHLSPHRFILRCNNAYQLIFPQLTFPALPLPPPKFKHTIFFFFQLFFSTQTCPKSDHY